MCIHNSTKKRALSQFVRVAVVLIASRCYESLRVSAPLFKHAPNISVEKKSINQQFS